MGGGVFWTLACCPLHLQTACAYGCYTQFLYVTDEQPTDLTFLSPTQLFDFPSRWQCGLFFYFSPTGVPEM